MIFYPPCRLNAYSLANVKYKYRSFHFKNYEILEILEILESYKKLQLNTNLMICEACCIFMKSVWSRSPFHPTFLHSYIYKLSTLRIICTGFWVWIQTESLEHWFLLRYSKCTGNLHRYVQGVQCVCIVHCTVHCPYFHPSSTIY